MNISIEVINDYLKVWTQTVRTEEVRKEIERRFYYRELIQRGGIEAELERCKNDVVHWFNTWVWTYDPRGMPWGLPANLPFVLRPKQVELVHWLELRESSQTHGLIEKSRDEGMSYVTLGFFLHHWLFVDGFAAGVGSRKEELVDKRGDPKSLFHKFRDMLEKLPKWMLPEGFGRPHDNYMRIVNPVNGATITGEAGDNIGRGGRTSMYLLDEWSHVERQELVDAAISQNTNVHIKGGTPNGIGDQFYNDRFSGRYDVFAMAWQDNPDKCWTVEHEGKPIAPWYEKQRATLTDVILAQEVDINYAASVEGVLIPSDWVAAAIDAHIKLNIEPTGAKVAALDVADEGFDLNAFAGRHGIVLKQIHSWSGKGSDIFATVQKSFDYCDDYGYQNLTYDADGLGSGARGDGRVINEQRREKGMFEISTQPFRGSGAVHDPEGEMVEARKNKDFFANAKAQAWWSLRLRFQQTYRAVVEGMEYDPDMIISLSSDMPEINKLKVELSQPTYSKNGVGKILVNKAPDGTKSPNHADAVMICYQPSDLFMHTWENL